jgi:hypothetical protein
MSALAMTKRDADMPVWSIRFVLISFVTFLHQGRKVRERKKRHKSLCHDLKNTFIAIIPVSLGKHFCYLL